MSSLLKLSRCWLLLIAVAGLAPLLRAQTPPSPKAVKAAPESDDAVGPILLRDESIDQVLTLLERWTGKTVLRPQALPATTITLTLKGNVTRDEAVRAIETLLTLNGVAITPMGDKFVKITPLANAKSEAPELIEGSTLGLPPSGRVVSRFFQLNYLRVAAVIPQITSLLSPGSTPVIFENANAALITDSLTNLQRVEVLLTRVDQPRLAGLEPRFYTLQFAKASDVVAKMHTILSGPLDVQIGPTTTYNPDDRTNQIILIADPRQHPFFDQLIAKLDVKSGANTRNDVIYLKHAAAKDVATSLTQLVSGQNTAARSGGGPAIRPGAPPPTASTPAGTQPTTSPVPVSAAINAVLALGAEASNQFSSLLTVLPEERSNSLIVSGTVDDIRLINELVDKIDVLLAQVRIEVVIAEVTLGDNASSGISALGLKIEGDKLVGFNGATAGMAVTDGVITRPGVVGAAPYDLAASIALVTTPRKSNATILSQPNIITTHNKEGKIFVGESRPVISSYLNDSSGSTVAGGTGYRSTVSSQDIGIDLSVKPLIGTDGSVQLEIKQAVNDVLGEVVIDGNPQPRIGKRTTESFVSVKSGEIIVLGGLQRTSKSRSTSRLGPIPIIGDMLGSRTREDTRTDLVFFLRPTVLTNTPADNVPALKQLEKFPKADGEAVRQALVPAKSL